MRRLDGAFAHRAPVCILTNTKQLYMYNPLSSKQVSYGEIYTLCSFLRVCHFFFRNGTNGRHYLAFWDQTLQISRRRLCNVPWCANSGDSFIFEIDIILCKYSNIVLFRVLIGEIHISDFNFHSSYNLEKCLVRKIYHALAENIRNHTSIHSCATIGRRWNAIRMAFRRGADRGTILRAYWEVGGQWAK